MIGEASGIVPDRGMNILYRVVLNTLGKLTDAGLTQSNYAAAVNATQAAANTRLSANTPNGILGGMIVSVGTTSGTIVAANGANTPVGIAENSAVGYPYESMSGVGSGKVPYLSGAGAVFATDLYETANAAGNAISYSPGQKLYSSANGLLINLTPTSQSIGSPDDTIIGVVLTAPSTSDPFMVVQMRL
jgi:hypothetical protein